MFVYCTSLTNCKLTLKRCVLREYNAAKCDCGCASAPDPAEGAYSAPPDFLAGFKGPLRDGEREGREVRKRKGKGREGQRGRGREEEVDSDAQLEQGRRLAKAGPDSKLSAIPSPRLGGHTHSVTA